MLQANPVSALLQHHVFGHQSQRGDLNEQDANFRAGRAAGLRGRARGGRAGRRRGVPFRGRGQGRRLGVGHRVSFLRESGVGCRVLRGLRSQ